jgi:crotonobetainyl-CoA:carnitine CoA-transferase CaiB-like acyl-CoA transferase
MLRAGGAEIGRHDASPSMLDGIRVTDMTSVILGPYCTQMLSDMGADVVKVEPGVGDTGRTIGRPLKTPGMGAMHMMINRGKRSVSWDLKTEEGRERLRRLVVSSDVFIHNVRSEAIERLGLDYQSVRPFAPEIIYVHCTAFDSSGPDATSAAYDDIIQGSSGIAALLPLVDGRTEPRYMPMAIADKVAGLYALQATLAAIVHKLRYGAGQFVEVPMFEAVTAFTLLEHLGAGIFPDLPRKMGYSRQISSARQPSPTADGYICIAPYNDDRWRRFFEAVGREDVLESERFAPERDRNLLYQLVAEITPQRTTAEWLGLLKEIDIPARQVNNLGDLFDDPQLKAVDFFTERTHPTEGRYLEVRPVVKYGAQSDRHLGYAPHVGQHTAEMERELGIRPDSNPSGPSR